MANIKNETIDALCEDFDIVANNIEEFVKTYTDTPESDRFTTKTLAQANNMLECYNWVFKVEKEINSVIKFINERCKNDHLPLCHFEHKSNFIYGGLTRLGVQPMDKNYDYVYFSIENANLILEHIEKFKCRVKTNIDIIKHFIGAVGFSEFDENDRVYLYEFKFQNNKPILNKYCVYAKYIGNCLEIVKGSVDCNTVSVDDFSIMKDLRTHKKPIDIANLGDDCVALFDDHTWPYGSDVECIVSKNDNFNTAAKMFYKHWQINLERKTRASSSSLYRDDEKEAVEYLQSILDVNP